MPYVRVNGITCESCQETHDFVIPLPAYPRSSYEYVCPTTGNSMLLSGIPVAARTVLYSVPNGCVETTECNP
jgi:hypothetical protein